MRLNRPLKKPRAHEGACAVPLTPEAELERSLLACLLWEDTFYESGESIASRLKRLVPLCPADVVAALAVKARNEGHLRHAPLLLLRELARHPDRPKIAATLASVIQRADEPAEFLAMYWQDKKEPLSGQVKKGLAAALQKFDAYQLAKYNRAGRVKIRDVLFLVHARPKDGAQAAIWKQLIDGSLPAPDTWEVALSAGADKKDTFTRLLREGRLGYLALLRNLRNMADAGVDGELIKNALLAGARSSRALPFRFIAAANAAPQFEPVLEQAMLDSLAEMPRLPGKTIVLVDVSGSMTAPLSRKSDLSRLDAACALAVLVMGIAEDTRVFSFSDELVEVPPRKGLALRDAIVHSQRHYSTYLGNALEGLPADHDRVIVITDEQTADPIPDPKKIGYMLNVASYENGVGYGAWTHIDGFSESVIRYIQAVEAARNGGESQ